jgi:hypothetical protein
MSDSKQPKNEAKRDDATPKPKESAARDRNKTNPAPDDSIEGEGSPGLTITGGGGHA